MYLCALLSQQLHGAGHKIGLDIISTFSSSRLSEMQALLQRVEQLLPCVKQMNGKPHQEQKKPSLYFVRGGLSSRSDMCGHRDRAMAGSSRSGDSCRRQRRGAGQQCQHGVGVAQSHPHPKAQERAQKRAQQLPWRGIAGAHASSGNARVRIASISSVLELGHILNLGVAFSSTNLFVCCAKTVGKGGVPLVTIFLWLSLPLHRRTHTMMVLPVMLSCC